jgi:signal transduction histidine kinase
VIRRLWPRTLAARTALVLLVGLALVQGLGLTIHAFDRIDLQRFAQIHDLAQRAMGLYRGLALLPPAQRPDALDSLMEGGENGSIEQQAALSDLPPEDPLPPAPPALQRQLAAEMQTVPVPLAHRPADSLVLSSRDQNDIVLGLRFPDSGWLVLHVTLGGLQPWHSRTFLIAFLLMTAAAAAMSVWAVRRLTGPVRVLAQAAERLGRDVEAAPLPEVGPQEVAAAAAAFNTMAERIRRFVSDRTLMLTAIGHDLRTPITRLRLRAEFVEDETLRERMLRDLDDLEGMVSATLAFGRDAATTEMPSRLDLAELLRTVLDEAGDAAPEAAGALAFAGPAHLTISARPLALKRALTNLIGNAVTYGASARVTLAGPSFGRGGASISITIDDDGPGIPAGEEERVFQPFHRIEQSRNRETGGVGLGLPIARNILRAHGGDVTLANRPEGGLRAMVTLPV